MTIRVLWLDNDPGYLTPYVTVLRQEGYEVRVVATVGEAEELLRSERFDMLILDVMIPTISLEEESIYPPNSTDEGLKLGLRFYERMKSNLDLKQTVVLVMTVRIDKEIMDAFESAGLRRDQFGTKTALNDVSNFLTKVKSLVGQPAR